ncbi:MAG TPA: nucleotidyltransferase domain-containing protein [Terriglobales bacterium]|nr:nucleotidyltransferase domain-containing protein [Terriglobales bacterium]
MSQDTLSFGRPLDEIRSSFSSRELDFFSDLLGEIQTLYGERLKSLKLVGSRARGTAMERSDYDFLVLLDTCDYSVEVPKMQSLSYQMNLKHGLGCISLSPLSTNQFIGLDTKFQGITDNFRRDAITLWP